MLLRHLSLSFCLGCFWSFCLFGGVHAQSLPDPLSLDELLHFSSPSPHTFPKQSKAHAPSLPIYQGTLHLDERFKTYTGTLRVQFQNHLSTPIHKVTITLPHLSKWHHQHNERILFLTQISVENQSYPLPTLDQDQVILTLPKALLSGQKQSIYLEFQGTFSQFDTTSNPLSLLQTHSDLPIEINQTLQQWILPYLTNSDSLTSHFSQDFLFLSNGLPKLSSFHLDQESSYSLQSYAHYDLTLSLSRSIQCASTGVEIEKRQLLKTQSYRKVSTFSPDFTLFCFPHSALQVERKKQVQSNSSLHPQTANQSISIFFPTDLGQSAQKTLTLLDQTLTFYQTQFTSLSFSHLNVVFSPFLFGLDLRSQGNLIQVSHALIHALDQLQTQKMNPIFIEQNFQWLIAREVAKQIWNPLFISPHNSDLWLKNALIFCTALDFIEQSFGPNQVHQLLEFHAYLPYHFGRLFDFDDPILSKTTQHTFSDLPQEMGVEHSLQHLTQIPQSIREAKGSVWLWTLKQKIGRDSFYLLLTTLLKKFRFMPFSLKDFKHHLSLHLDALKPNITSAALKRINLHVRRGLEEQHGDEDLPQIQLYSILKSLFGDSLLGQLDPQIRRWLHHQGVHSLGKALNALLENQTPKELDQESLKSLLIDLMKTDPHTAQWVPLTRRMLDRSQLKTSDLLREIGQELAKEDEKTGLIFQSLGLFVDALNLPDQSTKNTHRQKKTKKDPLEHDASEKETLPKGPLQSPLK